MRFAPDVTPLSTWYEIRLRGILGDVLLGAFPALQGEARDGDTVLCGWLVDQAALHGVLAQVEALGLELIGVQRLPRGGAPCDPPRPERAP